MRKIVEQINALEPTISALWRCRPLQKTPEFKQRFQNGESLDKLLPEAFAVCRERQNVSWVCVIMMCS